MVIVTGAQFAAGVQLGAYRIAALIGAGGMGEVYRARDTQLRRDVAIKVLPRFLSSDSDRLRRFEHEAQAAAALNHPNILSVFQFGIHEGVPYLVSELLEGETLREHLRRGRIPLRKAVEYAIQTSRGLAAAHDKGIVHRDLKPENLFVARDGCVKILDFGLAKLTGHKAEESTATADERTKSGTVLGTVGYMSPEQVRGKSVDHRSDIFAFGAILYEMLTTTRAFQKQTTAETMSAILNEDPPAISRPAPDTPPALQRVVHRCLEKHPEQRFQSTSDLAFALEALSDSGSAPANTLEQAKTRVRWVWIATAAILMVALATAVGWWRIPPAAPQVEAVTQLTNDGEPKEGRLVSDGLRIYFSEGQTGNWKIVQVSVTGGQTALINTRLQSPEIAALAPDGSTLLTLTGDTKNPRYRLWAIPLPAGEPRRVGEIEAVDASFFPDGRIVFSKGNRLYTVERDGSSPRQLIESRAALWDPAVSRDGKRIGFTSDDAWNDAQIDEVSADGRNFREMVKQGAVLSHVCCGRWTDDGRYLVFENLQEGRRDLWAVATSHAPFRRSSPAMRLTNGPLSYTSPTPSRDGRQIFAIGSHRRGELVRYEAKSRQFLPYLSGISASDPTFSNDGKWVAYTVYPDRTLCRSRIDGSERSQLTYPPLVVTFPFISPDGNRVAFNTPAGEVYIVTEGGTPEKIVEKGTVPNWSPDGNRLLFTCRIPGKRLGDTGAFELKTIDLRTRKISVVPNSQGMLGGFWLTQNTLVTGSEDTAKFLLFDFTTQNWTELAKGRFVNWFTSSDKRYLYCTTGRTAEPKLLRIRVSDHEVESIADLKYLRRVVDPYFGTQVNVSPDGSALFTRDIGTEEIYALTMRWP